MEPHLAAAVAVVAHAVPARAAIRWEGRQRTFAELVERARRLAGALAARGVAPGDRVGVALRNRPEHLEALLAAAWLGAVPFNVNWRYTTAELTTLFADAAPAAVVHEPDHAAAVADAAGRVGGVALRLSSGDPYERALAATPAPERRWSADELVLLYTGGTTGPPRGVMWRHRDLLAGAVNVPVGDPERLTDVLRERARDGRGALLVACPLAHGTGQWAALAQLLAGGTLILDPAPSFAAERTLDRVDAHEVASLVIVGDAFAAPLADALEAQPGRWSLASLAAVLSGGAGLSSRVRRRLSALLPQALIVDGYGASETGGHGRMVATADDVDGPPRFRVDRDTAVLGPDHRPVPPGAVGLVARRGHVPVGYWGDPERTARTFPVVDGVRWAVPGDLGMLDDDGTLVLLGRASAVVNTGGEKVYPAEVESVLRTHPGVADALVVGIPHERLGECVTALVQPAGGGTPAAGDLTELCRRQLAGYKVPRRIVFVDHVARTPTGKPDYRWARGVVTGPGTARGSS